MAIAVPSPATAQTPLPFVVTEPGSGTVTIVAGESQLVVADGLTGPGPVVADPGRARLVVGVGGGGTGLGAVVEVRPGGRRSTIAWGLPGVADVAVRADGTVVFVTGVDDTLRAIDGRTVSVLARLGSTATGLTLVDGTLLVTMDAGPSRLVDALSGDIIGVVAGAASPARPATLAGDACLFEPSAMRVACLDADGAVTASLGGIDAVRALAGVGRDRLLVLRDGLVTLHALSSGEVLGRWATDASDVASLEDIAPWLPGLAAPSPSPSSLGEEPTSNPLLLVLGMVAGALAVFLTVVTRRLQRPPGRDDRASQGGV